MRTRLVRVLAFVLGICLSLAWLCLSVDTLGTTPSLMQKLMERTAPPSYSGLPEAEYEGMCQMITGYLAGSTDVFQYTFVGEGGEYLCFQTHEQAHMADIYALFVLARTVLLASVLLAAILIPIIFGLKTQRKSTQVLRGFRDSAIGVLALVALLGILGAVDFDRFFTGFHQVMFTNNLWLLNPRTDLLIRLMPTDFFVTYAALWLGIFLLEPLAVLLLTLCRLRQGKRHN